MKKITLILLMGTVLLSALYAEGSRETIPSVRPAAPVKIAVLNGPSGIGLVQLMDQSPFSDSQIETDIQVLGAPKVLLGQMLKEEWDAAVLPANMAAVLFNKGVGYKAAALTGMGNLYLVASDDLEIDSVDDLKNETIYIPGKNTTPDLVTQLIAGEKGLELKYDYSFNPSDLARALAGGVVKAAVLPEPLATIALKSGENLSIAFDMQTLWSDTFTGESNYPMTVLVVKNSFAESYPQLVDELLWASEQSLNWVKANPAEASALIGDYGFSLPAPIVKNAIPRVNYSYVDGKDLEHLMTPYFERLTGLNPGSVGGSVPSEDFYY
ncbi:MAG: ABC transporter substrate-binding protein [Spirochaetales bacterium]|nr:ABC transporter substrate-binding protein [Spirochaetales bacterium]